MRTRSGPPKHGRPFCLEAFEEAFAKYGQPEIFNTDQGSQFTSDDFTGGTEAPWRGDQHGRQGAWRNNASVERLYRSIKYEVVNLDAYDSVGHATLGIAQYICFYNTSRSGSNCDN